VISRLIAAFWVSILITTNKVNVMQADLLITVDVINIMLVGGMMMAIAFAAGLLIGINIKF
tara:strand:- start:6001 stop:6183 length:183 start_codon:yes stop_codon:yes gene_type:complete